MRIGGASCSRGVPFALRACKSSVKRNKRGRSTAVFGGCCRWSNGRTYKMRRLMLMLATLVATMLVVGGIAATGAPPNPKKTTICHWTGKKYAVERPFVAL